MTIALPQDARPSRLLDAMPAIAWSASADTFRFNYISPAAEKILGYPAERWLGEPSFWLEHLHPEDRHVARLCHNETLACRDHELVYRMIAADGRTVWLRDYVNVHVVNGRPVELFGVMVDITREHEAEAAWKESRESFRRMVEMSPDCIGVHVDGTYVYVNNAFVQLLGARSEDEVVGRTVFSLLDPAYHEAVGRRLATVIAGESVPYMPVKYRRVDGSLVDVEVAALPLRYGDQDAVQVIARDITESVQAQRALALSEQRYRHLVEDVSDILFTLDAEGRFTSLNRSFERSTGYGVDEWIGRPFTELFQARTPGLRHEDGAIVEYDLPARSGAIVTVEVSSQPRTVDGMPAGTIGMARDVTEHRNFARKLEEAKRMSSLGQIAASLAHEFNNVLMGIQPFVDVIGRSAGSVPGVAEGLGHITRAIGRGKRASQEILRFANPKEPQLFAIDAHAWLPTLLRQLSAALPASMILTSSINHDVRLLRGDREHLEQVITNLVFNARDAVDGSGSVHVGVTLAGAAVRVSISDDGCGLPPQLIDRIFEPLFTTKRNGTGLGLAIARRLMERQGGTLTAENRPGGGSVFHAVIPAAEAPPAPAPSPARHATGLKRVLLVEDDQSVACGLETLLRAEGYETTWVDCVANAEEAARKTRPHLAIIDLNLPDGNGADLVPLLRTEHQALPIILSTGHVQQSSAEPRDQIVSLMKPYEVGDLLQAIGCLTKAA
jgi:PAS domain S-box-containing protein